MAARGSAMKEVSVSVQDLVVLQNLRSVAGIGLGMLLAARLSKAQRKAVGIAVLASSFVIGVPFAFGFMTKIRDQLIRKEVPRVGVREPRAVQEAHA
jgi:hypothetical protein